MNYLQFVEKENARVEVGWILEVPNDLSRDEVLKAIRIGSRPKGEWIKNEYGWYYHCSVCKENNLLHTDEANALSNYCPNCGAEMEVGE